MTSSSAAWTFKGSQFAVIQYLYVGWLNGKVAMPDNVAKRLEQYEINPSDYSEILKRDPFSDPTYDPDPHRFVPLNTTFPYEPPLTASDPVPTFTYTQTESSNSTTTSSASDTYKVGLSLGKQAKFFDFAKTTFKETASWEWTNTSESSNSAGKAEAATVTIGGPSFGYSGSTLIQVYFDTLFQTFAFTPVNVGGPGVSGTLLTSAGQPSGVGTQVILIQKDGIKYQTFTNSKGEFKFPVTLNAPFTLQSAFQTISNFKTAPRGNIILNQK